MFGKTRFLIFLAIVCAIAAITAVVANCLIPSVHAEGPNPAWQWRPNCPQNWAYVITASSTRDQIVLEARLYGSEGPTLETMSSDGTITRHDLPLAIWPGGSYQSWLYIGNMDVAAWRFAYDEVVCNESNWQLQDDWYRWKAPTPTPTTPAYQTPGIYLAQCSYRPCITFEVNDASCPYWILLSKTNDTRRVAIGWSDGGDGGGQLYGIVHSIRDGSFILIETGYEYCLEVFEGSYAEGPNFGHFLNSACVFLEPAPTATPTVTRTNTPTPTATPVNIFLPVIMR